MLFCGVSDEELLKKKVLFDLIEPLSTRIENCVSFLQDIKPDVIYTVEPINIPSGPTIDNPDFDCIVATMETELVIIHLSILLEIIISIIVIIKITYFK